MFTVVFLISETGLKADGVCLCSAQYPPTLCTDGIVKIVYYARCESYGFSKTNKLRARTVEDQSPLFIICSTNTGDVITVELR